MRSFWQPINRLCWSLCFFLLLNTVNVLGEGTPQVAPNASITINGNTTNDIAALHIANSQFNSFASYDNQNVNSRLNIHITDPANECIYLGFSFGHLNNTSQNPTRQNFEYRILDPNGNIVFGPVVVRSDQAHIPDWQSAINGPEQLNGTGGYNAEFVSSTDLASQGWTGKGDYYIEFRNVSGNSPLLIDYWDITVVDCSGATEVEKTGRLWSYNWALFAINDYGFPNRPFNGAFYVCAPDPVNTDAAFITQIDFNGSGFRPAAFNVAFNSFGTANTGNIIEDRKSVENVNSAEPEYAIFLNDPVDICDTAETGEIEIFGITSCDAQSYCIKFVSSRSGQIDILLDFDGADNIYTPGTADVMLTSVINPEDVDVEMCLDWDGLNGLGESVYDNTGIEIPITLSFAQGIYHFPIYDAELMTEGYRIKAVRPSGSDPKLFYDDSNMTVESGSGENPINLSGCDLPCHSWTNYSNPGTVGFGNLCTINSWWFSQQIESQSVFILPSYIECSIEAPEGLCEGSATFLYADNKIKPEDQGDLEIVSSRWVFSGSIIANDTAKIEITDAGEYFYEVEWTSASGDTCFNLCSILVEELENSSSTIDTLITFGDTIIVNGESYEQEGSFEQIVTASNGCDSTITIILEFLDPVYTCEIIGDSPICFGDTSILEVITTLDPIDAVPLPITLIEWSGPGMTGNVTGETIEATRQGTYIAVVNWTDSDGENQFTECSFDLDLNPRFARTIDTLIIEGEVLDINGLIITEPGEYSQEFVSVDGCDSTVFINVISQEAIVFYDFNDCKSIDFSRFTADYPTEVLCGTLQASNVYRVNPEVNGHSCTPGVNGETAMCIGSLDDCNYNPESDKRLIFELEVYPELDSILHLTSLNFFERAPEEFQWEIGTSGLNNYPLYYGIRVFINGAEVFNQFDIPTTTDWTREIFNFVNIDEFIITEASLIRFELLPYCLAGVDSHVSAWDIDELSIQGSCGLLEFKSADIEGRVVLSDGSGFPGLVVQLENEDNGKIASESLSGNKGDYAFDNIQKNLDYRISTYYNEDPLNGVSTADIVKIQRHILGLESLSSPYLMIAADVDNSSSISAVDLIHLKKLILGIYEEFPQNESWRFHDASEELSLDQPWGFREYIELQDLDEDMKAQNLNAIKIGDVNLDNSAARNASTVNRRSLEPSYINIENTQLPSSVAVSIELEVESSSSISSFQTALKLNSLQFMNLELAEDNSASVLEYHLQDDILNIIYYNHEQQGLSSKIKLILNCISDEDQRISQALSLNTDRLSSTVYELNDEKIQTKDLQISFDNTADLPAFESIVKPNPFTDNLRLVVESSVDDNIQVNVYSLQGERIKSLSQRLNKGSNEIELDATDLGNHRGILVFEVISGNKIEYHRVLRI